MRLPPAKREVAELATSTLARQPVCNRLRSGEAGRGAAERPACTAFRVARTQPLTVSIEHDTPYNAREAEYERKQPVGELEEDTDEHNRMEGPRKDEDARCCNDRSEGARYDNLDRIDGKRLTWLTRHKEHRDDDKLKSNRVEKDLYRLCTR